MPAPPPSGYSYQTSPRSRLIAAGLTVLFLALALLTLVVMGRFTFPPGGAAARLVAIAMPQGHEAEHHAAHAAAAPRHATTPQPPTVVAPPPPPVPHSPTFQFIHLSHADMTAADISRMTRHDDAGAASGDSKTAYGPGEGPGGAHLFNAEWYREPSHAQMAGYLPNGAPPGSWALIACQTVEHYHVENCQQLGENPPGSGLSRALREAAWQFLVRPPRINGKPQIGAWVRIRFDFTRKGAKDDAADQAPNE